MKCPLGSGGRVEPFAWRGHEVLLGSRDGAGDEDTESDLTGIGEADYLVAGGRDYWDYGSADAEWPEARTALIGPPGCQLLVGGHKSVGRRRCSRNSSVVSPRVK